MRYYSTQRPLGPGTYPARSYYFPTVVNFPEKTYVEEIGREAWGYLESIGCLPDDEVAAWELKQAGMKVWWCVTTSVDDRGKVVANITNSIEAVEKPENSYTSTSRRDIYQDWFGSYEEAQKFVEEAKRA